MYHWMDFLHAINSDRQTRLLNVFGQIATFWEIKYIYIYIYVGRQVKL